MQLKATVAASSNALDSKGKAIHCEKGGIVDVSDEVAEELLRHIHPEIGPIWKRADGKSVVLAGDAGPVKPANVPMVVPRG